MGQVLSILGKGKEVYPPETVATVKQFLRDRMVEKARKRGITQTKMFDTVLEAMNAERTLRLNVKEPDHATRLKAAEFAWKEIYGLGAAKKSEFSGPGGTPIPVKHMNIDEVSEKRAELRKLADMRAEWDRKRLRGKAE